MDSSPGEATAHGGGLMTPSDFVKLHDYIDNYCSRSIKDVLVEMLASGTLKIENYDKTSSGHLSYARYKLLMRNYIETDVPESLLRSFFLAFLSNSWKFGSAADEESGARSKRQLSRGGCVKRETLTQFIRRLQDLSKAVLSVPQKCSVGVISVDECADDESAVEEETELISIKEVVCCLSLLEAGDPKDKLDLVFKIYDTDGNGFLDAKELEHIVDQMTSLADHLEWDVNALKPILQRMIVSMDTNSDGKVSLSEWKNAGLTTVPLLVLLGMGSSDEGCHKFLMKHFNRPTYCNRCRRLLFGLRKQGLCCVYCKYTLHEQCAELEVLSGCITTYCSRNSFSEILNSHHWVEGNFSSKCSQCNKSVTNLMSLSGQHCRWCKRTVHDSCLSTVSVECDFGDLRQHILRPSSLYSPNPSCALDLQIMPTPGVTPLLVLINQKSGGKQGSKLMRVFQYLLNPRQVFDLGNGGPGPGLKFFKEDGNFKILCCGGDGTVGWLLEEMDKISFSQPPPVAILPLGTGNDLARCLGWGGGYEGEDVRVILKMIEDSHIIQMDRWHLQIVQLPDAQPPSDDINDNDEYNGIPNNIMNNYFSIGVDASIALRFHTMREKHPEKFSSRTRNKLWYFECGTIETLRSTCKNLTENIEIECDDVPLSIANGTTLECIAVLNIGSVYGGSDLWGSDGQRRQERVKSGYEISQSPEIKEVNLAKVEQDLGDGRLEVVGLESCIHLAQVKSGMQRGKRLCQCSKITIRTTQKFPMQIDGEPWIQGPCEITIRHHNQAYMLMSSGHSRD